MVAFEGLSRILAESSACSGPRVGMLSIGFLESITMLLCAAHGSPVAMRLPLRAVFPAMGFGSFIQEGTVWGDLGFALV